MMPQRGTVPQPVVETREKGRSVSQIIMKREVWRVYLPTGLGWWMGG